MNKTIIFLILIAVLSSLSSSDILIEKRYFFTIMIVSSSRNDFSDRDFPVVHHPRVWLDFFCCGVRGLDEEKNEGP